MYGLNRFFLNVLCNTLNNSKNNHLIILYAKQLDSKEECILSVIHMYLHMCVTKMVIKGNNKCAYMVKNMQQYKNGKKR